MKAYGRFNEKGILEVITLEKREVSIEQQLEDLRKEGKIYKEIVPLEKEKFSSGRTFYEVFECPVDKGDKIEYIYQECLNENMVLKEIEILKSHLVKSDYKIIKCQEANLLGETLPYNITALKEERQTYRDKINKLEELIKEEKEND